MVRRWASSLSRKGGMAGSPGRRVRDRRRGGKRGGTPRLDPPARGSHGPPCPHCVRSRMTVPSQPEPRPPDLRPDADAIPQDWSRLRAYLATRGHALAETPPPRQFAGGLANLNYLVTLDGAPAVL